MQRSNLSKQEAISSGTACRRRCREGGKKQAIAPGTHDSKFELENAVQILQQKREKLPELPVKFKALSVVVEFLQTAAFQQDSFSL